MKIKTIWQPIEFSGLFDTEVNNAIEDGWKLKKVKLIEPRGNLRCTSALVAHLEKYEAAEEEDED